jgi:xylulokinase
VRALLTGIVLESRRCFDVLRATAGPGDAWAGGGGSVHPQLLADLAASCGRTVLVPTGSTDYSAVGAALLVLPAALDRALATVAVTPDPAAAARWDSLFVVHEAALGAARSFYGSAS